MLLPFHILQKDGNIHIRLQQAILTAQRLQSNSPLRQLRGKWREWRIKSLNWTESSKL